MNGEDIINEINESLENCSDEAWSGDWSHDWSGDWPHESWSNDAWSSENTTRQKMNVNKNCSSYLGLTMDLLAPF